MNLSSYRQSNKKSVFRLGSSNLNWQLKVLEFSYVIFQICDLHFLKLSCNTAILQCCCVNRRYLCSVRFAVIHIILPVLQQVHYFLHWIVSTLFHEKALNSKCVLLPCICLPSSLQYQCFHIVEVDFTPY